MESNEVKKAAVGLIEKPPLEVRGPESPYEKYCSDRERVMANQLSNERLTPEQRKQLSQFRKEFLFGRNLANPTHGSYMRPLFCFGLSIAKDYRQATEDDVRAYLESIANKSFSVQMWAKTALKVFYRWLLAGNIERLAPYPEIVRWIKVGARAATKVRTQDILSEAEVLQLLSGCRNARDRAFIKLAISTGARSGELLNARIRDLHMEAAYPYLEIRVSKTKPRNVPLMDATPDVRDWLNAHPQRFQKDFADCFIFVPIAASNKKTRKFFMSSVDIYSCLQNIAARGGLAKKVWPHLLRHCAASRDAAENMEQRMANEKYGWSNRSGQWFRYSHIGSDDIARWQAKTRGHALVQTKNPFAPVKCPRCGDENGFDSCYCRKCAMPLKTSFTPPPLPEPKMPADMKISGAPEVPTLSDDGEYLIIGGKRYRKKVWLQAYDEVGDERGNKK